ncbi:MAG: hypothetical protein II432_02410, partial [Erysipelotrichaceae bacterium]|nr:hypothetical protein [Erysipelotrichaceae bacterium]
EEDMVLAANRVIDLKGGIVTVLNEKMTGQIALEIAGLLSKKSVEETAKDFISLREAFTKQGYVHSNSIMNFCLMSLTCIPTLKLTDRGYFNTETFELLPLYEELQ